MRFVRFAGFMPFAFALAACADLPTTPAALTSPLADMLPDPTNPDRITYTFDELTSTCLPGLTSTGLYEDLVFPSPVEMVGCLTPNGTIGLIPTALVPGSVEVRVQLPRDGLAVSIESFLFSAGNAPTLVAYDVNGVQVGAASDGTQSAWATLQVDGAGAAIRELGLLMPQNVVYLDNLTVTYRSTTPPPDPEPTDPTTRGECSNGGWETFGFSNLGLCVRFVETGLDDR